MKNIIPFGLFLHILMVLSVIISIPAGSMAKRMQCPFLNPEKLKPGWFWNQPSECGMTAVGLDRHSFLYPENAIERAHEKSIHNLLRQRNTNHSGGQAFSITERGAVWLGDDLREWYDTTGYHHMKEQIPILDTRVSGNVVLVLTGPEACRDEADRMSGLFAAPQHPEWIRHKPVESGYIHAVGVSEGYYYPVSSWERAEYEARLNLSATVQSRVMGLHQQRAGESFEIIYSDLTVDLKNIVIMSRYHDPEFNLYYILIRMPVP